MVNLKKQIIDIAKRTKAACFSLLDIDTKIKNKVLREMAESLLKNRDFILKENHKDIDFAKNKNFPGALIDRLTLSDKRIKEMAASLIAISMLPDPIGKIISKTRRPNGLIINKVRVPIGVIVVIYESRPNVTSDCIGLCFKSSNAVILRGGSEAINSNRAIYKILREVLIKNKINPDCINLVPFVERNVINVLLKLDNYIDLVMPRGGESLIRLVTEKSKIPVIKHYKGVCHIFVDNMANLEMALKIIINAKVQRPGVCNAVEKVLVHRDIAKNFLPKLIKELKSFNVEVRGCPITKRIVKDINNAREADWYEEYLDLILAIKVVNSLEDAITHINYYGSRHSDSIITEKKSNALRFLKLVDSACVYQNASTRFTDGFQFGMGGEIGISTDKIHARGPMALEELTTYKYEILGRGQIRE
ncbi:MAG: glutamate-5-semialdehyde dehydrogenase [Candidatus Omnitrophota bacterium]